jgi:UDP-GlcNAc:undecaprenyl-phosphate GlcNAc-1-phosphate transferase
MLIHYAPISMWVLTAYALTACLISFTLVRLILLATRRSGHLVPPRSDRWHRRPTPTFGGVAIALTAIALTAASGYGRDLLLPLACGACIFVVGFVDDVLRLKPSTKLIAQIAIGSMFLLFGYRLDWVDSLTLDVLLTLVWIVGITNAFNLLDNMDGLSAGIAIVVGVSILAVMPHWDRLAGAGISLAILIGATGGFLFHNVHPARIFMGDSGSLFLGLNLAVLTLGSPHDARAGTGLLSAVAAPVLVMLIPILDSLLVTVSRLLWGRSAAKGGRDHSSHRLVAIGLPERTAVAVLWTLAALGGGAAWASARQDTLSPLAAALFAIAMVIFAVYLARVKVYDDAHPALLEGTRFTPVLFRMMYKRRVAEVLLDVCLVSCAYYATFRLKFEGPQFTQAFPAFLESLPIALAIQLVTFFVLGVYRPVWRFFSLNDAVVFARSGVTGVVLTALSVGYLFQRPALSPAVFIIYGALLLLFTTGSRASFRLINEFARRRGQGRNLVVYGAEKPGSLLARELLTSEHTRYAMIGFIDDDQGKQGTRVQGYPVLGGYDVLTGLVEDGAVDSIVVAFHPESCDHFGDLVTLCRQRQIELSRLQLTLEEITTVPVGLLASAGEARQVSQVQPFAS